jgi:hypothetical protein
MVLSQEEIDGCREAFLAFDKDRSGMNYILILYQLLYCHLFLSNNRYNRCLGIKTSIRSYGTKTNRRRIVSND